MLRDTVVVSIAFGDSVGAKTKVTLDVDLELGPQNFGPILQIDGFADHALDVLAAEEAEAARID